MKEKDIEAIPKDMQKKVVKDTKKTLTIIARRQGFGEKKILNVRESIVRSGKEKINTKEKPTNSAVGLLKWGQKVNFLTTIF